MHHQVVSRQGAAPEIRIQEAWAQRAGRVWAVRGVGDWDEGQARGTGQGVQRGDGGWCGQEAGAESGGMGDPVGALWPVAVGQGQLGTQWALVRPAEAPGCRAGTRGAP